MAVLRMPMARAAMVGPVVFGLRRMVLSNCSFHLRMTLSVARGVPQVSMGQAGPLAAFAAGALLVTAAAVAATRVATTIRVAASLFFTRVSLSAARQTPDGHDRMPLELEARETPLLRAGRRVTN